MKTIFIIYEKNIRTLFIFPSEIKGVKYIMEKSKSEINLTPPRDYRRCYQLFNPDGSPKKAFKPDGTSVDSVEYYKKFDYEKLKSLGYILKPILDPNRKVEKYVNVPNLNMLCEICEDHPDFKNNQHKAKMIIKYKDDGKEFGDEGKKFVCPDHSGKKEVEYYWDKF